MAKSIYNIKLDIKKDIHDKITVKQEDSLSRYLSITLIDNSLPIDIVGHTVKVYILKPDGTKIFTNATIINAKEGKIEVELSTQALALSGEIKLEIVIYGTDKSILTSMVFSIDVRKKLRDDTAIESTNEFTALTETIAITQAQINEMKQFIDNWENRLATKAEKSIYGDVSINTSLWAIARDSNPNNLNVYVWNKLANKFLALQDNGEIYYGGKPIAQITPTATNASEILATKEWTISRNPTAKNVTIYNKVGDSYFTLWDDGKLSYAGSHVPRVRNPVFEVNKPIKGNTKEVITHNLGYKPMTEVGSTLGNILITWYHKDNNTIEVYNYGTNDGTAYIRCW